jgi:hypothetical protein
VVEDVGVASAEAARASDEVSKLEGHLVHEAEGAAARRLREADAVRLELGKRVGGPYVVSRARAREYQIRRVDVKRARFGLPGRAEASPDQPW